MTTEQSRRRRLVAAASLTVALGATLAACSSGPPSRQVASLPGHNAQAANASGSSISVAQSDEDFVRYTQCLRAHGVNEPDPRHLPGHVGLSFQVPADSPANHPALAACSHFIAKEMAAKESGAHQELTQWLPSFIHYASCMRSHDIPMLDPGPQGELNLGNVPGITSDFGRYSPQFRSADAACRHLLPHGVRDNGTGP